MHINRISNTQFKGAYFITGDGEKVKQAEEKIIGKLKDKGEIKRLGYGFTTNDMPAYLLITTGEDVARYNKFASSKLQDAYEQVTEELPPKKVKEDFDTAHDFLHYRLIRKGIHTIEAIKQYCDFKQEPQVLEAEDVLDAIRTKKFNYLTGETI